MKITTKQIQYIPKIFKMHVSLLIGPLSNLQIKIQSNLRTSSTRRVNV